MLVFSLYNGWGDALFSTCSCFKQVELLAFKPFQALSPFKRYNVQRSKISAAKISLQTSPKFTINLPTSQVPHGYPQIHIALVVQPGLEYSPVTAATRVQTIFLFAKLTKSSTKKCWKSRPGRSQSIHGPGNWAGSAAWQRGGLLIRRSRVQNSPFLLAELAKKRWRKRKWL